MDYTSPDWRPAPNECHFSWNLDKIERDYDRPLDCSFIDWLRKKLRLNGETTSSLSTSTKWRRFLVKSTLAYELAKTEQTDASQAVQCLTECLDLLEGEDDFYIVKYKKVLQYITFSLTQYVYAIMKEPSEVKKAMLQLSELKLDDSKSRAAILGFRAEIYCFYGSNASPEAEQIIRQAIQIFPEEAEWHLCLGILLSRTRRWNRLTENGPTDEELDVLTFAYENSEELATKSTSALYLASSYQDKSIRSHMKNEWDDRIRFALLQKQYLRDAFNLNPDDLNTMAKCAKGMLSGPRDQRCYEEAYEMATKILEKDPKHITANETASLVCVENNMLKEALKYSRTAANEGGFGSFFTCLRLMMKTNQYVCARSFFSEMLRRFHSENFQQQIHVTAIAVYLLFKDNEVFEAAMHLNFLFNCNAPILGKMTGVGYYLNVFEVIRNQIMVVLDKSWRLPQEDRAFLEEVKRKVENACPRLRGRRCDHRLIENIVNRFGTDEVKQLFFS